MSQKYLKPIRVLPEKITNIISYILGNLFTYIFVCICWIFFRADSFSTSGQIISRIFTWQNGIIQIYSWVIVAIIIVIFASIIAALKARKEKSAQVDGFYIVLDLSKFWNLVIFFFSIGLIFAFAFVGASPFIYFQF